MKRLLIVDDSYTVRKVIEMLLAPLGYNLSFAESSSKAMEIIKTQSFDAVVLDYGLPTKDSIALSKEIKSKYPGLPLLLMFSNKEELSEKTIKESLCDETVEKPFDSQTFLAKMDGLKNKSSKIMPEPSKEEFIPKAEAVLKAEPFFDFDLGEEFTIEAKKPEERISEKVTVKPEEKEEVLELEDFEELEELEEIEEAKIPEKGPAETKKPEGATEEKEEFVEEISLEELLEEEPFKEEALKEEPEISFEELEEEVRPETQKFPEEPNVSIEDFFADLNDILAEKEVKAEPKRDSWETVKLKPAVAEVAKDLEEFESVGKEKIEKKVEAEEELDVWGFEPETEEVKKLQPEVKPAPGTVETFKSFDNKEIERMVKEITYEVVEKIAWEVVPEIVDTIMKDKLGRK